MFEAVLEYIDLIFAIARPRNLIQLAIDGGAPSAYINKQSSGRIRAARGESYKLKYKD